VILKSLVVAVKITHRKEILKSGFEIRIFARKLEKDEVPMDVRVSKMTGTYQKE
jgi:hypothetical protein